MEKYFGVGTRNDFLSIVSEFDNTITYTEKFGVVDYWHMYDVMIKTLREVADFLRRLKDATLHPEKYEKKTIPIWHSFFRTFEEFLKERYKEPPKEAVEEFKRQAFKKQTSLLDFFVLLIFIVGVPVAGYVLYKGKQHER